MKRFTETEKWKDPWFRGLSPAHKLVFLFVIENCNAAGFYEVDPGQMAFHTGLTEIEVSGAIKGLNRGLLGADGWVWVRTFLKHQKNEALNPANNAHRQIIGFIKEQTERFRDCPQFRALLGAHKGLLSPIGKVKVKVEEGVQGEETEDDAFSRFWIAYPKKMAKEDARKAWKKIKPEEHIDILRAVALQATSEDWTKDGGKFIPYPASWLNGRRWEDSGAGCASAPKVPGTAGCPYL